MTALAPNTSRMPRPSSRFQGPPIPVRSLPAELLDVDLDVVHPADDPDFGPSDGLLLRCSAVLGGIIALALLAGEIVTYLF
ncbi:hypothetical protein GCM10022288_30070 [Gryllotalpicola kribbensis]|uniref:Uncharacterized protein n=1 Tax=Gryllotalpicola kribbensis TaxID=993084 RepID=A0ABP8AZW8_9MICO